MGKKIQIELIDSNSSDDDDDDDAKPGFTERHRNAEMRRALRKVTNTNNPPHVREKGLSDIQKYADSEPRAGKKSMFSRKRTKSREKKPLKDKSLVDYFTHRSQMNRNQKMTLEGKLYRRVDGTDLNLPHSFNALNTSRTEQHRIPKSQAQYWRKDPDSITVEEFSTDLLRRKGVKYWISELMKRIQSDPGSLTEIPNIAYEIIRNYTVVVFSAKGSKSGRETSKILERVQDKHNLRKEVLLELIIDDSKAGAKTYNDLVMITQMRGLPQIFIGETFIGGYDALKKLNKFKKVGPMILEAMGYNTWRCKLCEIERVNAGKKHYVQNSREYDEKLLLRSHLYPGHD